MAFKTCNKKSGKGFTLVEIIVVLVILAILAAATIPAMLGFVKDAKSKALDNESVVVRRAAQAYATEHFAKGDRDEDIESAIVGKIDSDHALYSLLQNDANGTIFKTDVKNGKIEELFYTKDSIAMSSEGDFISTGIRYTEFNADKTSLLHAEGSITNLNLDDFKAELKSEVINSVYPIGALYTSYDSTSPATLFGGTWTQIKDTFLYCADSAGSTGGSSTHTHTTGYCTLTVSQIPSHNHSFTGNTATGGFCVRLSSNGTGDMTTIDGASGVFSLARNVGPSAGFGLQIVSYSGKEDKISFSMTPSGSIGNTGSGSSHNHGATSSESNLPPYLTVYCWRRTE